MNIFVTILNDETALLTWLDSSIIMNKNDAIDILKLYLIDMPTCPHLYVQ